MCFYRCGIFVRILPLPESLHREASLCRDGCTTSLRATSVFTMSRREDLSRPGGCLMRSKVPEALRDDCARGAEPGQNAAVCGPASCSFARVRHYSGGGLRVRRLEMDRLAAYSACDLRGRNRRDSCLSKHQQLCPLVGSTHTVGPDRELFAYPCPRSAVYDRGCSARRGWKNGSSPASTPDCFPADRLCPCTALPVAGNFGIE